MRLRYAVPAAALLLATTMAACRSDGADRPPPEPSTSAEDTTSPGDSASASPDGPAPATGEELANQRVSLRFPEGYRVDDDSSSVVTAVAPDRDHTIYYTQALLLTDPDLDYLMQLSEKFDTWETPPRRMPPVTIGGVECFHLRGRQQGSPTDAYGTQRGDDGITLTFVLEGGASQRQRVIDSVLATVEWAPL